ncbi:MAG: PHP domain-containing protein [Dehalococcoidales bacterium]|nr:MAG: PHP domain-containing protein [Dehalococcoidales bacterium]
MNQSSMEERFRYDCSGKWFKGNLHMHTTLSDGRLTLAEACALYAERGYDFISITDHRVPFVGAESGEQFPIMILDGIELDGRDDQGSGYHAVCIGDVGGISRDMDLTEAMEKARAQGCFLIWAHPYASNNTVAEGLRHGFHGLEIYNHSCEVGLGKGQSTYHWDSILRQQIDMLGLATDDNHFFDGLPTQVGGWVMVNATELSPEGILASIRQGNFYSSSGPEFKSIYIEKGNRVVAETSPIVHARLAGPGGAGKWKAEVDLSNVTVSHFRIPDDWPYARLEIADAFGGKAWSNTLLRV